jgi:hypothetical protein
MGIQSQLTDIKINPFLLFKVEEVKKGLSQSIERIKAKDIVPPASLYEAQRDLDTMIYEIRKNNLSSAEEKLEMVHSKIIKSLFFNETANISPELSGRKSISDNMTVISRSIDAIIAEKELVSRGGQLFDDKGDYYSHEEINNAKIDYYLGSGENKPVIYQASPFLADIGLYNEMRVNFQIPFNDDDSSASIVFKNKGNELLEIRVLDEEDNTAYSFDIELKDITLKGESVNTFNHDNFYLSSSNDDLQEVHLNTSLRGFSINLGGSDGYFISASLHSDLALSVHKKGELLSDKGWIIEFDELLSRSPAPSP